MNGNHTTLFNPYATSGAPPSAIRSRGAKLSMIRIGIFFLAAVLLSSGCVSHKTCILCSGPSDEQLQLHESRRGIIFGVCGPVTRADSDFLFYFPERKDTYTTADFRLKGIGTENLRFEGTITMLRSSGEVEIKLDQNGHAFEFNGRHHYQQEFNNALGP